MKYGISDQDYILLEELLIKPLKLYSAEVWIFGSRVGSNYHKFSDVDLIYKSVTSISQLKIADLKETIENSNFPYKVDLVNENELIESYKENILKQRIQI